MIAASVFVVLLLIFAQIVQSGGLAISSSRKHLTADAQAREVFSRFELDLSLMPNRSDLDVVLSSSNNAIFFLSEVPGFTNSPTNSSTLSLVGYRVNTTNAQLERLGKGLSWTNSPFLAYTNNSPTTNSTPLTKTTIHGIWSDVIGSAPAYSDGSDIAYDILADGVFRIFYYFQKKDGSFSLSLDPNALQGRFNDVAAIVLTLAILDGDSRKIVTDLSKLASALPDPTTANLPPTDTPARLWQDKVNNVTQFAADALIPVQAASRVRIYQRSFLLNAP